MDKNTLLTYLNILRQDMRGMIFNESDKELNGLMARLGELTDNHQYKEAYELIEDIRNVLEKLSPPTIN